MKINRIETNRLILRTLQIDDAQAMFDGWCHDIEVARYTPWTIDQSVEDTIMLLKNWIKQYDDPLCYRYGIEDKSNGRLIGTIDVTEYVDNNPEIGCCIMKDYWHQGIAFEACQSLINLLFSDGFNRIYVKAVDKNIASNKMIMRLGFKYLKSQLFSPWSRQKPEDVTMNWYYLDKKDYCCDYE